MHGHPVQYAFLGKYFIQSLLDAKAVSGINCFIFIIKMFNVMNTTKINIHPFLYPRICSLEQNFV